MSRAVDHSTDATSLTLLQLAAGCALLVFGLRVLTPAPVPAPQWPAPAVMAPVADARKMPETQGLQRVGTQESDTAESSPCDRRDSAVNSDLGEAGSLQTAVCFTANTPSLGVNTPEATSHF